MSEFLYPTLNRTPHSPTAQSLLLTIKTQSCFTLQKDLTVDILQDLVEYIVCKIPPLQSWLSVWNGTTSEYSDKRRNEPGTNEPEKSHDKKMTGSLDDEVQCSVLKRQKTVDCRYVTAFVKTLLPSGKIKVKRTKVKKLKKS